MTHITCRLTAKNRDQLRNPTLGNRVWATFYLHRVLRCGPTCFLTDSREGSCRFGGCRAMPPPVMICSCDCVKLSVLTVVSWMSEPRRLMLAMTTISRRSSNNSERSTHFNPLYLPRSLKQKAYMYTMRWQNACVFTG